MSGRFLACVLATLGAVSTPAFAQVPVVWSLERADATPLKAGSSFTVLVKAEIEFGWHLYGTTQPAGGPIATQVWVAGAAPFSAGGTLGADATTEGFDPNFNIVTQYYDDHTVFRVPVRIAAAAKDGRYTLTINARYQSCNDTLCIPPRTQALQMALVVGNPVAASAPAVTAPNLPSNEPVAPAATSASVAPRRKVPDLAAADAATTLGAYVGLAALMGALSLLTPCVFPMVPITVSYFTNRAQRSRRDSIRHALVYGLGIVLTFTALGFALAILFGPRVV